MIIIIKIISKTITIAMTIAIVTTTTSSAAIIIHF